MQMTASEQQKPEDSEALDERARKRQAIGLSAVRPTAKAEAYHPPVQPGVNGLPWLAVLLLVAMLAVTLWLLLRVTSPGVALTAADGSRSSVLLQDDFVQPILGLAPEVVTSD